METREKVILDVETARHGEKLDATSLWVFGGKSGGILILEGRVGALLTLVLGGALRESAHLVSPYIVLRKDETEGEKERRHLVSHGRLE